MKDNRIMNHEFFLLAALATILSVVSIDGQAVGGNDNALRTVSSSMNKFAVNFYQNLAENESGNFISSPLSVSMVLAMLSYGARGTTEQQLRSALNLGSDEALTKDGFKALIDSLKNVKKVEFRLANNIFMNNGLKLEENFQKVIQNTFQSSVQEIDFFQTAQAARIINDWAAENTNNKITDLFSSDDLRGARTVLANAVYFKGNWKKQFSKGLTKPRDFHVNERTTKKVDTMYIKGNFYYGEAPEIGATYIEIPYESDDKSSQMSMIVIVPDEINDLRKVESNLNKMNFAALKGSVSKVQLFLPKFRAESRFSLERVLKKLGVENIFESSADFGGITKSPMPISQVIQKAYISVDENGSEAAAATGGVSATSFPGPQDSVITVKVDRPFVYAIVHGDAKTVLFQGHVTSPVV